MIKELVYENKNVAFFCSTLEHFRELIMESKKEGIVFSKTGYIEEDFKRYENNLHEGYSHIILMVYYRYHISRSLSDFAIEQYKNGSKTWLPFTTPEPFTPDNFENYKEEIQFYVRSYKDYDTYNDWDKYKIIDYTQILRDIKLKEILNG